MHSTAPTRDDGRSPLSPLSHPRVDRWDRSIDRSRSSGRGRRVERARALSRPFVETRSVCEI